MEAEREEAIRREEVLLQTAIEHRFDKSHSTSGSVLHLQCVAFTVTVVHYRRLCLDSITS
jgi:hypothetical protein